MTSELSLFPAALAQLRRQLGEPETTTQDLLLSLRALQRMRLSAADLRVHVERLRAVNEATNDDPLIEENALLALDLIEGHLRASTLRWDSAEMATIYLPDVVNEETLDKAIQSGLAPMNILPPRPAQNLPDNVIAGLKQGIVARLKTFSIEPQRAELFRVPKAGLTSRPAALLAPVDRLLYEALAETLSPALDTILPSQVHWPRGRAIEEKHSQFTEVPKAWNSRYVVVTDIESFYECVDHALLAHFLTSQTNGRTTYKHAVESFLDTVMGSTTGLPQGPQASDLFASAYLSSVDELLVHEGWTFARYADDYLIAAESVADGRRKIELLESALRDVSMRLNASKTRVMRRSTYVDALERPPRRVQRLHAEVSALMAEQLSQEQDDELVASILHQAGIGGEMLWDLFYHKTLTIDDVVQEFRDRLTAPLINAYATYFDRAAESLRSGSLPEDMPDMELDLRECLTILASAERVVGLEAVDTALKWFPRLAPPVASYLTSIARLAQRDVSTLLSQWLTKSHMDWVTAWLCHVPETTPLLVSEELKVALRATAQRGDIGLLTRSGATRALAAAGQLDEATWDQVLKEAPPAIRAELVLARRGAPERYPGGLAALESDNPLSP